MFLNPEPLAPFADLDRGGRGRADGAADDGGAPRRRRPAQGPRGAPAEGRLLRPLAVRGALPRRTAPWPPTTARGGSCASAAGRAAMGFPQSVILTPHTEMSMKFMVEISRGCPCMCRFCWAGYNYLPVRGFTRAELVARAREVRGVTSKIGLVSTAVCDHPEIDGIVDDLAAHGLRGLGRLAAARRPHPAVRLQAGRHRRPGPHPRPRVRLRPHAADPQQAVHERRDPRQGHLDLRERHPEPEALLHGGAAVRGARRRRGDRRAHRPDPRADARGRARPRADRPHPPLGEPLRAEAGDALPVAADGGPEGDRPQAPVPAQGLRAHAERGRDHQERAHGGRPVDPGPGRPARGRRPRDRGARADGPQARDCARRGSTRPSTSSAAGRRTRSCPGTSSTTASARSTSGRSSSAARQERLSPHCPEIQGCIRCGVCVETPNPFYALPEKWKGRETLPFYERHARRA